MNFAYVFFSAKRQKRSSSRKLLFYYCSSSYCFGARGIFFLLFVLSFKRYQATLKPFKLCETLRELLHEPKEAVVTDLHHNVTNVHLFLCKSCLTKHSLVITYSYNVCWEGYLFKLPTYKRRMGDINLGKQFGEGFHFWLIVSMGGGTPKNDLLYEETPLERDTFC